jgi:hypothetical protein
VLWGGWLSRERPALGPGSARARRRGGLWLPAFPPSGRPLAAAPAAAARPGIASPLRPGPAAVSDAVPLAAPNPQLALRDRVFLFDLLALCRPSHLGRGGQPPRPQQPQLQRRPGEHPPQQTQQQQQGEQQQERQGTPETEAALSSLLADVAASPSIAVVGFCLRQDLERVHESYPWLPLFAPRTRGPGGGAGGGGAAAEAGAAGGGGVGSGGAPLALHVDLPALARALLPPMAGLAGASLSRLCRALLGAPLDKGMQCSDWGARPLSAEQRRYAAADAAALVALYEEILRRSGAAPRALAALDGGLRELPVTADAGQRRWAPPPPDV